MVDIFLHVWSQVVSVSAYYLGCLICLISLGLLAVSWFVTTSWGVWIACTVVCITLLLIGLGFLLSEFMLLDQNVRDQK